MSGSPERESCERCGREVEPGSLWRLGIALPDRRRAERDICVYCAVEVQRFLLGAAAPEQPAEPAREGGWARLGSSLARGAVYVAVAAAFFLLVTWLTSL